MNIWLMIPPMRRLSHVPLSLEMIGTVYCCDGDSLVLLLTDVLIVCPNIVMVG
jgi:hypothetical protein